MYDIKALRKSANSVKSSNVSIGTPNGKYAPPAQGPFHCMGCIHFHHIEATPLGGCDHPEVYKDAESGFLNIVIIDGMEMAEVHHEGCSEYYNPGPLKATSTAHQ